MATSLALQLKKLRAPQTAVLLQDKKRPSLLFNPKEAANLDRAIVLNIGQSGLQDLIKLCSSFAEFESSLFSPSSVSLERSVQDTSVNKRLNAAIAKFMIRLSPYFLLNSAHKALEWLIHRFHVHLYNRNEFMLLILPYHETRIFVRALQLLDLSDESDRWNWLEPLQKPGVPLPSLSLVTRLSTDNGLLKMLCKHVVEATAVCGDRASSLSTLYAFWTMSIVGALERSASITELQTIHILGCLAKGLSSSVIDFAAGSYMIVAKLCTRASLDEATLDYLLAKTLKTARLQYEATLLIFFVYENSASPRLEVSDKIVKRVARSSFFVDSINRIKQSGLDVTRFLVPFVSKALDITLKNPAEETSKIRDTISAIFDRVTFDESEIDLVLQNIARAEPNPETCEEATIFLADLYDRLEKLYPSRFDEHLKRLMMTIDSGASKATLQFLMSWHTGARNAKDSLDILDRLNHPIAEQRIAALEIISRGEIAITETFRETVNRAMISRFSDDDPRVVKSLLEFPKERLKSLFPSDTLVDELMILLAQCNSRKRSGLARLAINLLLEICDDADDTSIFIATLPYLFPSKESEVEIAMNILKSKYSTKNRYMKMVKADAGENPNADAIGSAAFHNILKWELLPPTANILGTMKFQSCRGDATSMLFNLVLLGSVCRVPVGSLPFDVALEVIEIADEITKNHPRVKPLESCNQLNAQRISEALVLTSRGILPLQAFTYVIEMVHRRVDIKTNPKIDYEKDPARTRLVSRILEILLEGMSHESRKPHFSWCLKIFFQRHFASSREMLVFLSQFFSSRNPRVSLHCLKIAMDLLENSKSYGWIFSDDVFAINLLISLARENFLCRKTAVELLRRITRIFNLSMPGYSTLLHELSERSSELEMDPDQLSLALYNLLSPDPDVTSSLKREIRSNLEKSRISIMATLVSETTPIHTVAQLLEVLIHVNGPDILVHLSPLGLRLHRELIASNEHQEYSGIALRNILQRFNSTSVEALADKTVCELFDSAITDHRSRLSTDGNEVSPSTIVARQIDETFYDRAGKASRSLEKKILSKLVDVVTDCEIGSVVAACNRAVRRIKIDAKSVVEELRAMRDARVPEVEGTRPRRRSRIVQLPKPEIVETRAWKRGITLLEFVQRAENIVNEEVLVPMLFDILRVSLSFEIQSPLEYVNQLVLSTIYHLATKSCVIKEAHLYIDLIAQCIRISHNPQTHHHALLVLVELFRVANVEAALHSIMPIFTFMGSSVLRQDDAYSIQIISKTIETVVPIVNSTNDENHACEIIRVFVVSLPHIPEHRRIPVFVKLLQLLDKHLDLFFLLTFDAHVMAAGKPEANSKSNSSERLEFALTIAQEFSHERILEVALKILKFIRSLPVEIDEDEERRRKLEFNGKHVFDVANNSPKQLRHYKYTAVQFLVALITSPNLVRKLAGREDERMINIENLWDGMIVEVVMLVESATKSADLHQAKMKGKYWKVLLHNLYDILDAINNLLPNRIFVSTVVRLVDHDLLSVRKKALELLNARLQQRKFAEEDHEGLLRIVASLKDIVARQGKILSPELEIIQQTALISLKLMARLLAAEHPDQFKPILELTTELMKTKEGPLLASSVLCVAELCASMKTHAIQSLNKFVPAIMRLLRTHCNQESPDVVVIGIVSALQKIVESVGNFLSLYLDQLLLELTRLRSQYTDTEHPKIGLIVSRLRATTEKLASCIPIRVLLPGISKTYERMLTSGRYACIAPLMNILADSFAHVPPNELQASIPDLATFFLGVLQFREGTKIADETAMEVDEEDKRNDVVAKIEEAASNALVALVLKLSEATFRPLYYKLYDWAARYPDMKHRNITFYRLSATIAEHLKSLFVLFAGQFLKHAASLLKSNNSLEPEIPSDLRLSEESERLELVEAILLTLHRVFSYDAQNFVTQERFESLAQPIVDQLENTTGTREEYEKRSRELVVPCVASFASATQDDSLHKQLVYQVLLKTRHAKPYVRSAALAAIIEIARKLGEDFMPLLPETVPFLAELLEDEDEGTEKNAQNAVRTLEEILGEPLQKYF